MNDIFFKFVLVYVVFLSVSAFGETHLFVLSGQSNMDGLKAEAQFTPIVKKLLPGSKVIVVQEDERAMLIRCWLKEWKDIAKDAGLKYAPAKKFQDGELYSRLIAKINEAKGKATPDSVTFCWMQGESDALAKYSKAYEKALGALAGNLKKDLNCPRFYVVIGRLSDFSEAEEWERIRNIQVKYSTENENCAWVDTDDLNDKDKNGKEVNDLHYTKEGYAKLGQRFASQAALLIKKEKPKMKGK